MTPTGWFEWPDLSKPFWPFPVFAGVLLFILLRSAWPWLRRKRAARWPVAEGYIESVDVTEGKSSWYSMKGGSPGIAELGYSYSIAGTVDTGRYRRDFPTEQEAREFVRELKGKSAEIHYYPRNTRLSQLSEDSLEALLRNRSPILPGESDYVLPKWSHPFLWGVPLYFGRRAGSQPVGASWCRNGAHRGAWGVLLYSGRWSNSWSGFPLCSQG